MRVSGSVLTIRICSWGGKLSYLKLIVLILVVLILLIVSISEHGPSQYLSIIVETNFAKLFIVQKLFLPMKGGFFLSHFESVP